MEAVFVKIINTDSDRLSNRNMSEDMGISIETLRSKLKDIKEILITGGYK